MTTTTRAAYGLRTLPCTLFLSVLLSPALADDFAITSGLSAHWFNPERSGEGLVLEILSEESALLYWFTYDEEGNQRWLIDVGEIAGDEIVFSELTVTHGGRFGPDFDPDEVEYEVVGQAVLQFSDCDHSEFNYTAFGHSETIPMVRLSQTMAAGCQPVQGVPGQPVREYAGQSGSWYDPTQAGHGYTLQWMSRDEAVLIWFTYDLEGNQYWLLGTGHHVEGQIYFPQLHVFHGPRFGSDFDSGDLAMEEWGRLTLEIDCDAGTATWESVNEPFGQGDLNLGRLTQVDQPQCPWIQPQITDLFDIELINVSASAENIQADSVTSDGVIVGRLGTTDQVLAVRRELGDESWEVVVPEEISNQPLRVSPTGDVILANQPVTADEQASFAPVIWQGGTDWEVIDGLMFDRSVYGGASKDMSQIVGTGRPTGDDFRNYPWIWHADFGQIELQTTETIPGANPIAASNDGFIVAGNTIRQGSGGFLPFREVAVRWTGEEPSFIQDEFGYELGRVQACSSDCSVMTGADQAEFDPEHSHFREAWFWTASGHSGYLGLPEDAIFDASVPPTLPLDISDDGTIIVGSYPMFNENGTSGTRGFIWTQNTGFVSISDIFAELGIGDENWEFMRATSVSGDGRKVLLSGYNRASTGPGASRTYRVQLLSLSER